MIKAFFPPACPLKRRLFFGSPLRNKGFIAGLIKGHKALFLTGASIRGGLVDQWFPPFNRQRCGTLPMRTSRWLSSMPVGQWQWNKRGKQQGQRHGQRSGAAIFFFDWGYEVTLLFFFKTQKRCQKLMISELKRWWSCLYRLSCVFI